MNNHVNLIVALCLVVISEYYFARSKYHHHWCGPRLWYAILIQAIFPMVVVGAIYFEIFHTGQGAIAPRYWYLLSAAGALAAHFLTHHFFQTTPEGASADPPEVRPALALAVATRIEQKKFMIADQLRASPHCKELLLRAIDASPTMAAAMRSKLRRYIQQKQTDREIFWVIEEVGVAKMKLIMRGGSNGHFHQAIAAKPTP